MSTSLSRRSGLWISESAYVSLRVVVTQARATDRRTRQPHGISLIRVYASQAVQATLRRTSCTTNRPNLNTLQVCNPLQTLLS